MRFVPQCILWSFARGLEMNVHLLPLDYFRSLCANDSYDIIRLYLVDDPREKHEQQPVGVLFSHYENHAYHALIVGLDYDGGYEFGTYKQILFQAAERANHLGATSLDLAFTAELVKKKIGARPEATWAFVQLMDTYNLQVIDALGQGVANRVA